MTVSQKIPQLPITKISLKITCSKFYSDISPRDQWIKSARQNWSLLTGISYALSKLYHITKCVIFYNISMKTKQAWQVISSGDRSKYPKAEISYTHWKVHPCLQSGITFSQTASQWNRQYEWMLLWRKFQATYFNETIHYMVLITG